MSDGDISPRPEGSVLMLVDGDHRSEESELLLSGILAFADERGRRTDVVTLRRQEVPPCLGCLRCVTSHPGVCVHAAFFAAIAECSESASLVIFLTPVLFGSFSSPVKNVIDRGGLVVRNHRHCRQVIVGYGAEVPAEERSTFLDITAKHRGGADIVHPGVGERFEVLVAGSPQESETVLASLRRVV